MALTKFDFLKGIDFTALAPATAGDHNSLVDGAEPVVDSAAEAKSINIWTVDSAANVPIVPDPTVDVTLLKWKRYVWIRIPFLGENSDLPYLYVWNDNLTSDPTLLKWTRPQADTSALETLIADLSVQVSVNTDDIAAIQAIANAANSNAASAVVTAADASATATAAATTANLANTNATTALSNAAVADAKADTAITNSAAAVTVAGTAATDAANANTLAQATTATASSDTVVTLGSIRTIAHGLTVVPKRVRIVLVCVTPENGSIANDEVDCAYTYISVPGAYQYPAFHLHVNATNITILTSGYAIYVVNPTTNVAATITPARWLLRAYYSKS